MNRAFKQSAFLATVAGLLLAYSAEASVNKSIKVDDGATSSGASSVNGSVTVGSSATVTGGVSTVNGKVRVGDNSTVEDVETVNGSVTLGEMVVARNVETVNGSIRIDSGGRIEGEVSAVNGSIRLDTGGHVARDLSNVNGDIELTASEVGGDVTTVSGDVELANSATIRGNLIVQKPKGSGWFNKESSKPTIVIGPGSRVDGVIRLEREVKLYISESASVGGVEGVMTMDDAERFSGNRP
jgi:hypothetical protein